MKKALFLLVSLFLIPEYVEAKETGPIKEGNTVYANGYSIEIKERSDGTEGATISWDNDSFEVDSSATIFGGGKASDSFDSSNITMLGGTVKTIFGGGNGTTNESSNIETSNITIEGGKVTNAIFGGGLLAATTNTSNIHLKDGKVGSIVGGGGASSGSFNVGSYDTMHKSSNHTINANITVSGGIVDYAIYGGGQGYSHVNTSSIRISGNPKILYLIGSGSNGRVNNVMMDVNGGDIEIMHGINRGRVGNIDMKVNGANINKLYVLGDPNDPSVNGSIDEDGQAKLNITSGSINELEPGTNKGHNVVKKDNITIKYIDGTIENTDTLESVFNNLELVTPTVNRPILDDIPKTGISKELSIRTVITTIILGIILKYRLLK